jgi:hypothetical protein
MAQPQAERVREAEADGQAWRTLPFLDHADGGPADPGNLPEFLQRQTLTFPLFPAVYL